MAETYTKKNGHLVNSRGEWVWNGESYEYVTSHSDWLPLVFKSKADSDAFELLEKIWKAEQIVKNSHNQQEVTLAKEWLRKHSARHSDMSNAVYYVNGDVLQHWGKGKEARNHKYASREWVKGKWQYIYDTANKAKNKVSDVIGVDERDRRNEAAKEYYINKMDDDIYKETVDRSHRRGDRLEQDLERDPDNEKIKELLERHNEAEKYVDATYDKIRKETDKSRDQYKLAQLEYDKTLVGKVEKGMNLIKKLFKQK